MSHPLHPADPANADSIHVTPNLNQPNAPLAIPSPYAATSAIGSLNETTVHSHNPAHVNPNDIAFSNNSNTPPVQFLNPAALTYTPTATQELIRQASQGATIAKGTPAWQAAREQVMKSVGASPAPDIIPQAPKRGRPRGRPRKHPLPVPVARHADLAASQAPAQLLGTPGLGPDAVDTMTPAPNGLGQQPVAPAIPSMTPARGRGRPRGRGGRMATRGGKSKPAKRKRGSDDEDNSENNTSDSESHILESTAFTRSGRTVSKPTAFTPAVPAADAASGSGTPRNRKRVYRGGLETALCNKCDRGHSTISNVIVFCDGCNRAWHQWCHDPHISREVVDVPERAWFCTRCAHDREMEGCPLEKRIGGDSLALSMDETNTYLSTLSSATLRHLLLRAVDLHPELPIFAPNTRQLLKHASRPSLPPPDSLTRTTLANGTSVAAAPSFTTQNNDRPSTLSIDNPTLSNRHPAEPPSPAESTSTLSSDPYFDYDNSAHDPPSTYPRPGTGPIPLRPTTDVDDRIWLEGKEEDNRGVISHLVRDENSGGLKPLIANANGERVPPENAMPAEITATAAPITFTNQEIPQPQSYHHDNNGDVSKAQVPSPTAKVAIQSPEIPPPMSFEDGNVNGNDVTETTQSMQDILSEL